MRLQGFRAFVVTREIYEATDHDRRFHQRIQWRLRLGRSLLRHQTDWNAVNWTHAKRIAPLLDKSIFQSSRWKELTGTPVSFRWKHYFDSLKPKGKQDA